MWRRNAVRLGDNAQEDHDSDQSISEEEEGLEDKWTGNTISLGGRKNNKGTMQLLSQLEILRESCKFHSTEKESVSSHGKKGGYHIEDEVEVPIFNDEDGLSHYHRISSDTLAHSNIEKIYLPEVASISNTDEESFLTMRNARENTGGTGYDASREVEALVWSHENSRHTSPQNAFVKEKISSRGSGRTKSKHKFLSPFHIHNKDRSLVVIDSNERTSSDNIPSADEIAAAVDVGMDDIMAESQLNIYDKESKQPENQIVPFELAYRHDTKGHSMAEFLSCFLERSDLQEASSELEIQERRILDDDDDDIPEDLDTGSPFRSEEENAQGLTPIIPRSMADQFHEAFGTVSVIDDSSGLYRKLQQVMQSEREKRMDCLKKSSAETGIQDEEMSIVVKILSRSLEAKLIVCSCTSVGDGKNSYWENNLEMKMKGVARALTILFNPIMCSDVDLEAGNLIRIHPPWKEVQVKDETIFLCSFFDWVHP